MAIESSTQGELTPLQEAQLLQLAKQAALEAGKAQMASYGRILKVEVKGSSIDLVTAVDKECDELIVGILKKSHSEVKFITEETFSETQAFDLSDTWVVDPLDGTTNYAHAFPHFAVSIAYFRNGQPQLGVIYDPFKKEMFYALKNRGAFLNDTQIFVSNNRVHSLSSALLATGFPYDIATSQVTNLDNFARVAPRCHGVRRPGAAALDLAYVACGRLDAFWELKLSLWDIAAGVLLVEEAGGSVTDLNSKSLHYASRRIDLVGSNGTALHDELRALLSPQ